MEFWGAEVKPGKPLKVTPDEDCLIHISQAALGETKKNQKGESVPLFAKVGDQKFVLGTLSQEQFPQINFDLVFEKEFELSHNWKNGSIYVIGYKSPNIDGEDEDAFYDDSEASDEEKHPVTAAENGKANAVETSKPAKETVIKPKAKAAEAKKDVESDSEDNESDNDEDDESDSEAGMDVDDSDDSDDEDEDSEDEDEGTPKKVEPSKKRPNESASKTPIPAKKVKAATPQKTDGKKGGHTATPHPAKKGGKTPNSSQSPKSGGQVSCGSCKKSFNSDVALQSHNKAKHGGK